MVHSGCENMDSQEFCHHLIAQEMVNGDSFVFKQPDAKEFVLEAIDEYWDWHFCQDEEGIWYYEDKSERTQVDVGQKDGGEEIR